MMAISLEGRLEWRRTAPFHVQLELEKPQDIQPVSGDILVQGRTVRVFRTDGRLAVGDRCAFALWACRAGDEPTGPAFIYYEDFLTASYVDAYLHGNPPECKLAGYEFTLIRAPSDEPILTTRELEVLLERFDAVRTDAARMPKATRGWQFWQR
jgi:hypothetical protein